MARTIYLHVDPDGDVVGFSAGPQDGPLSGGFEQTDTSDPAYVAWYEQLPQPLRDVHPVPYED